MTQRRFEPAALPRRGPARSVTAGAAGRCRLALDASIKIEAPWPPPRAGG